MKQEEITANGAIAAAQLVFAFSPASFANLRPDQFPQIRQVSIGQASSTQVRLHLAPAAASPAELQIPLVDDVGASFVRGCYVVPRLLATTGAPWSLWIVRPAAVNSTIVLFWDLPSG